MNSHLNFATLLKNRELCALYIVSKNQPQNLQLFEIKIVNNFWLREPTPISTFTFFHEQWRVNNLSAEIILKTLHKHHETGVLKKLLVDSNSNLTYIYIPSLRKYLE